MDYCRNDTSDEFESKILNDLLSNLRKFDLRTIETKPNMAKARKRVVFGAIETRKQLELGKVKVLIIARNLSNDQLLDEDFKFCINENSFEIPKIYALTRKQLGTVLLNQTSRIGIVGILKLDGVHEIWNELIDNLKSLQESWIKKYENDYNNIFTCAFYGHADVLQKMFEQNKLELAQNVMLNTNIINQGCFKTGKTPLLVAVERDHYEVVKLLIEQGADQDIPDFTLNRPIHLVKSKKIASLLEYSDKENAAGLAAIETAIINQRVEVIQVFMDKTRLKPERLLFTATIPKSDKSMSYLLKQFKIKSINDFMDSSGNDLFMKAVKNGAYEVFKYLIGQKFEINFDRVNLESENIMEISKKLRNIGISRYLEKHYYNKNKLLP